MGNDLEGKMLPTITLSKHDMAELFQLLILIRLLV